MRLGVVADAAGTTTKTLRRNLGRLRRRGVCDEAAARLFASGGVDDRVAVLDRALTPPPIVRRAALDRSGTVSSRGAGTAAWASSYRSGPAPRRAEAAQAASRDANRVQGAASGLGSAAMLVRLSFHPNIQVRGRVLENVNCPRWLLERVVARCDPDECCIVAGNPAAGSRLLERLTSRRFDPGRMIVTWPSTGNEGAYAAKEADVKVAKAAAGNSAASAQLIERLVGWSDTRVYTTAALNPAASPQLLKRLAAAHPDRDMAYTVASNPSCGPKLLRRLARHTNSEVRARALEHRSYPVQTSHAWGASTRPSCARWDATPAALRSC